MSKSSLIPNGAEKAGEAVLPQAILPPSNPDLSPPIPALAASKPEKSQRLAKLEQIIAAGRQTFVDVGSALLEIRDLELYKPQYRSFEAYCIEKWGFAHSQAYRLMDAATIAADLSPNGEMILKESHARALARVPKEQRTAVLHTASRKAKAAGRQLTAKDIAAAATPASPEETHRAAKVAPRKSQTEESQVTGQDIAAEEASPGNLEEPLARKAAKPMSTDPVPADHSTLEQLLALWAKATAAERQAFLARIQPVTTAAPDQHQHDHESEAYACNNCGEPCEDLEEAVPLYGCDACGTSFTRESSANGNHQFPECN